MTRYTAILLAMVLVTIASGIGVNPYPLLSINGDRTPAQVFITAPSATAYITSNGSGVTTFYLPSGGGGGSGNGTVTSVSVNSANGLSGSVSTPTTTPSLTLSTSVTGVLKGDGTSISAQSTGNLSDGSADGISVSGGSGAVLGSGTTITQQAATTSTNGYLTSTDWTTFNSKQASGSYMTALTGDGTAAGPGSSAMTLATVNSNVGSFSPVSMTVNGKGLVTAASSMSTTGSGSTVALSSSPTFTGTVTTQALNVSGLTATTVPYLDGSKNLSSSAVTPTELGYVSGVTSAIQAQISAKAPTASPIFTGTVTAPALNVSGQTASTVPYLDAGKSIVSSSVTPTQLGYLGSQAQYTTQSYLSIHEGNGAYVDCGNVLPLERTDAFSWSGWFNTALLTDTYGIVSKQTSPYAAYVIFVENSRLFFEEYGAAGPPNALQVRISATLTAGIWYHFVVTTDGTGRAAGTRMYLNGTNQALSIDYDALSTSILNSASLQFGGLTAHDEGFSGLINNIAYFNRVLSAGEVTTIYNSGRTSDLTTLFGSSVMPHFWRLGNGDNATTASGMRDSVGSLHCTASGTYNNKANIVAASPDDNSTESKSSPIITGTLKSESYSVLKDPVSGAGGTSYILRSDGSQLIKSYNSTFACMYAGGTCILTWQYSSGNPLVTIKGSFYPVDGDNTGSVGTITGTNYGQARFSYGAFTTLYSWGNKNAATQTTITGSAGTAVCSEPEQGTSWKKVVCKLTGFSNTSDAYTFPTAFTAAPYIYGTTGGVAVSSASTTALTFTSSVTQTGFVFAEGY